MVGALAAVITVWKLPSALAFGRSKASAYLSGAAIWHSGVILGARSISPMVRAHAPTTGAGTDPT